MEMNEGLRSGVPRAGVGACRELGCPWGPLSSQGGSQVQTEGLAGGRSALQP